MFVTRSVAMRARLRETSELTPDLRALAEGATSEGFGFGRRLVEEWESGANRFDRPNEFFLLAELGAELVGFGGLNVDPFQPASDVGRLRHLYVAAPHRGTGVGATLLREILRRAASGFARVRLHTREAAPFYEHHGFRRTSEDRASHAISLSKTRGD